MAEEDKKPGRSRKNEPWVVRQARQEVEQAQAAVDSATSDITRQRARDELKKAQDRLRELLKTARRDRRADRSVTDAQAAVDAAAQTPGSEDDRQAQADLEAAKAKAEKTQARRDEARQGANEFFLSEMGPMIAEAVKEFPQLREFFRQAIAGGWDAAKQQRELNNPDNPWFEWWQKRGSYWQSGFRLQYGPGVTAQMWNEKLASSREIIRAAAIDAGVTLTAEQESNLARRYWYMNWQEDPDALTSWMQERAKSQRETGVLDPEAEVDPLLPANRNQKISQLRDLAEAYGLEFNDTTLGDWADLILDPKKNTNGIQDTRFKEFLVQEARSKYVTFGDQLDADTNLRQLAGGYVSEMARLLELDPASIRFTPSGMDPLLQRALTNIDPATGKPSRIPLWEFTKQVRQDERWQYTDNARDSYMTAGTRFAQALGLAG